jgi:glycerol-3-phosphate dehydrogenase (NAD(P)+)
MTKINISVIGAGTWGTAMAKLLAGKGHNVNIWAREDEVVKDINQHNENKLFLQGVKLPKNLKAYSDINDCINNSTIIINAVPTQFIRDTFSKINKKIKTDYILSLSKGIEVNTFERPSEILKDVLKKDVYVLSGPNFATEIASQKPAATTIAGRDKRVRKYLQQIINTQYFRVYENDDIIGIEISGALKNVMAIAAGMADAIGLGNNAKAALITRGLNEIRKLGKKMGAKDITFLGLSGIGDLLLTCNSNISRNYTVGYRIGRGEKIKDIITSMNHIAEGIKTSYAVYKFSKKVDVDMPITKEVYSVLYKDKNPKDAATSLMSRSLKPEF